MLTHGPMAKSCSPRLYDYCTGPGLPIWTYICSPTDPIIPPKFEKNLGGIIGSVGEHSVCGELNPLTHGMYAHTCLCTYLCTYTYIYVYVHRYVHRHVCAYIPCVRGLSSPHTLCSPTDPIIPPKFFSNLGGIIGSVGEQM